MKLLVINSTVSNKACRIRLPYKLLALFLLFLTLPFMGIARQNRTETWPDSLNTAKNIDYLTDQEKNVIYEMNKVRTNPKKYAEYLEQEKTFYNGIYLEKPGEMAIVTQEGLKAVDECIEVLKQAKPVGILSPEEALCKAARLLAQDQSESGQVGHSGSNGSSMKQRIERYGNANRFLGENCSYGANEAKAIVMQLLIDDGVPSRGHRDNIMSPKFSRCGVAIKRHPRYRNVCVIDYASE